MRKREQEIDNDYIERIAKIASEEFFDSTRNNGIFSSKRLRFCSATVLETAHFYFLKSYNTIVAFIKKDSGEIFDILRYKYKFTRTSAQHISKFIHDYTKYPWTNPRYTWREIK